MNTPLHAIEPTPLWQHFANLNAIPRASKKEAQVIQFIKQFGETLGLETIEDHVGNVIIKKPASAGMENRQTILMQSHLDMVHQKNADTVFDFDTQGINMIVDGDWIRADGTTLGADNGIGVASIMAVLASTDIVHPQIEALFTVTEEIGLIGAAQFKAGQLDATIMLNLDTEDDDELTIGCAGSVTIDATGEYEHVPTPDDMIGLQVSLTGLTGGHSGVDIHLGRANANKLMNRVLYVMAQQIDLRIATINGGSLRNAIPRESFVTVAIPVSEQSIFTQIIADLQHTFAAEYATTDPTIQLSATSTDSPEFVLGKQFQTNLIRAIYACPNGIYRLSPDVADLVQSSNNFARVLVKNGAFLMTCLSRSSVDSEKEDLAHAIKNCFDFVAASVDFSKQSPGWTPNPNASIVTLMRDLYEELFAEPVHIKAVHAGLECGVIGSKYPEMELISFGPNIRGAHSPDERVQISSVQKYWRFLLETLKRIPDIRE